MNIVFVIFDTLRWDYLGLAGGNDWIQTPHLDRLAERSWIFDRMFIASFPTIPFRRDVMTGRHGGPFHPWQPLPHDDEPTLPQTLARGGYVTQLLHDTPHLVNGGHNFDWPFHAWTQVRGAEVDRPWVDDIEDLPPNYCHDPLFDCFEGTATQIWPEFQSYLCANRKRTREEDWNCAQLFLRAADFVRDNRARDNAFLWIDSFDPHEPFDAPPEYVLRYDKTPGYDGRIDPRSFRKNVDENTPQAAKDRIRACYAAKVTWVDHQFGRLLDALEETGMDENTAIVVTSDHGTNLGEFGLWSKVGPLHAPVAHVPLLICAPGAGSGRCDLLVQPQDLYATLCSLAGVETPAELSDSHDILAAAKACSPGPRSITLSSRSATAWREGRDLLMACDGTYELEFHHSLDDSILRRLDHEEPVADGDAIKADLHQAVVEELARRGSHPELLQWLKNSRETPLPDCPLSRTPTPPGYTQYWRRGYMPDAPDSPLRSTADRRPRRLRTS